jgi:hypothetical protein
MHDAVVYGIELGVGLACAVAAVGAWRRGLRWVGIVAGLAALAAVVHALWALAT